MKSKAFTLIELLGVIMILGILVLVVFPPVLNQIKKSKQEINESTKLLIIDAAKDYVSDNINDYDEINGNTYCIPITTLTENNYLNEKIKDENLNNIDDTKMIKMTYHNNAFIYEITNSCTHELIRHGIEVPIVTTGSGLYESEIESGRLIYRGGNPNNYIILNEGTALSPNNITYRIVSYETDGTIKVVRDEKLFNKAWDEANVRKSDGTNNTYCTSENGCNVWGDQTNTLYNGSSLGDSFHYFYYSSPTATTLSNGGAGKVGTESTLNKYLNDGSWTGLSNLESYIDNHSWNVGGVYYTADDKGIIKEKEEESVLTWNGKVGLMNITEYVEASLNPTCTSARSNYSSSSGSPCKESNWTYKNYHQWSLSPNSRTRNGVWIVTSAGFFDIYHALSTFGVRPAFYLKSEISLTGEGTTTTPYSISNM